MLRVEQERLVRQVVLEIAAFIEAGLVVCLEVVLREPLAAGGVLHLPRVVLGVGLPVIHWHRFARDGRVPV